MSSEEKPEMVPPPTQAQGGRQGRKCVDAETVRRETRTMLYIRALYI